MSGKTAAFPESYDSEFSFDVVMDDNNFALAQLEERLRRLNTFSAYIHESFRL